VTSYRTPRSSASKYFPQSGPYTFGARGEFTHTVTKTFKDLRSLWDIPSADVELVPGHGRSMLDSEVDYRVFTALYGAAPAPSRVSADLVARELNSAALGYGDLPRFTFNAYAAPGGEDIPGYGTSHRRIAFGDGVLARLRQDRAGRRGAAGDPGA